MNPNLNSLLEVSQADYSKLFSTIEHGIVCKDIPPASIRLHFIRHFAGGLVPLNDLVETLISYITHFCLAAERRAGLGEQARNKAFLEARKLFRKTNTSGQPGELLVYFLIEAVLQAPQVLKKMLITTNPELERNGSDGVHVRWAGDMLELIFAEAKLHKSFGNALTQAFKSITDFHNSATKGLEINFFLNTFNLLSSEQQKIVKSYIEGENKGKCSEVQVCLIGHTWDEYQCLKDRDKKDAFLKEFEARYLQWAETTMKPCLECELTTFTHSHLRFEFFFLPFTSVDDFRTLFLESL